MGAPSSLSNLEKSNPGEVKLLDFNSFIPFYMDDTLTSLASSLASNQVTFVMKAVIGAKIPNERR